jgi:hypothetical protein
MSHEPEFLLNILRGFVMANGAGAIGAVSTVKAGNAVADGNAVTEGVAVADGNAVTEGVAVADGNAVTEGVAIADGNAVLLPSSLRRGGRAGQPEADSAAGEVRSQTKVDWSSLLRLAEAHAVTPLLYTALGQDESVPETFREALRSTYETSVRQSLAQTAELTRIAEIFGQRRIPFVALKGPMLSQYLYSALGARSSGDIDVLVRKEDIPRIRKALIPAGYRLRSTLHWNSDSALVRSREEEISFESPSDISIDVHWRLMPRYSASAFDKLTGWESLKKVPLAGREIQTLSPEPLLLFLCAHGAKHMFERLGWICDIARFLQVTPNLDWHLIIGLSKRTASLRQLLLGVTLAADLLGAPPAPIKEDAAVKRLAQAITDRLLSGATPPAPPLESTRYMLRLLETRSQRLRCRKGLYLTPSEAEYRALRLPPLLFFLYYPYRPMRLVWKHGIVRNPKS